MPNHEIVSHLYIKIEGNNIPDDAMRQILEVVVDQQVSLPGMFMIRLSDYDFKLLDSDLFALEKKIEISGKTEDGKSVTLIKGEITAIEPEFGEGMVAEMVVRGYDQMHRLYRQVKSKTYLNVKDSDLAEQVASAAKLTPQVEATKTVYDHIYQHNQSDLSFLMQRAWRIGYECFVDDGKLIFRQPKAGDSKIKLVWGQDLNTFRPRMSIAEQVDEVVIKGWDVQQKSEIIGRANKGELYPKIDDSAQDAAKQGKEMGKDGKMVIVDQSVFDQAEADIMAAARLNELSGNFIEADGEAFRRPDIRAGQVAKLEALGKRFSGSYLVTGVTHTYTSAGFKSNFSVRGLRRGLLLTSILAEPSVDRWPGVVPAIVTNTDDPNEWGRVKVKYPWMSDEDESDWVLVASPGAGPTAGFYNTPAVQDEVLVGFIHGHFNQPVILGGLWNKEAKAPKEVTSAPKGERPKIRTWNSRTGHRLTTYDNAKNKVELVTAGEHKMVWDDANKKIEIISKSGHQITLDDANKKIEIKSSSGLTITMDDGSKEIKIDSSGKVTVNGNMGISLESSANIQVKAGANLELQASGQVTIKGAMVSLN